MKKNHRIILLTTCFLTLTSCASIVSKTYYPISINSTPTNSKITVVDRKGIITYKGNTPASISLKAGSGYFTRAEYQVTFEMDGYDTRIIPIQFEVDGWYVGNIVFGGLIGFLIVDPLTGAMYKLNTEYINQVLSKSISINSETEKGIKIITTEQVPEEWKEHLVIIE